MEQRKRVLALIFEEGLILTSAIIVSRKYPERITQETYIGLLIFGIALVVTTILETFGTQAITRRISGWSPSRQNIFCGLLRYFISAGVFMVTFLVLSYFVPCRTIIAIILSLMAAFNHVFISYALLFLLSLDREKFFEVEDEDDDDDYDS